MARERSKTHDRWNAARIQRVIECYDHQSDDAGAKEIEKAPEADGTIEWDEAMTIQEIQRLREAKPFEPFRVLVADGNSYDVEHLEFIAQNPSGRLITIGLPDNSFVTLDLLLVAGIQKGHKRKSGNGKRSSPRRR